MPKKAAAPAQPEPNIATLVERYIALRDAKTAAKAAYELQAAKYQEAMDKIEGFFLAHLNEEGAESVRTTSGTFFKSKRTSATVADWDQTIAWVMADPTERLAALEHRVSKSFVEQYAEEHNQIPPGLNYSVEYTVNVRRPTT